MTTPRHTFDRHVGRTLDGNYYVSRRDEITGYYTTWFVEPCDADSTGWRIWKSMPSNRPMVINSRGRLGRQILARVLAAHPHLKDRPMGGV